MTKANAVFSAGVMAGVQGLPATAPDKYWEDPYLVETWLDGHEEGCIRDVFYCKQIEMELHDG
jgi:hypothetical protein